METTTQDIIDVESEDYYIGIEEIRKFFESKGVMLPKGDD